ncbi:hypothetical protein AN5277.2 [Aspergillus nidulans FGSC A4]|uniref:Uncharacterized protein n=1 Tax=Emericella nidulans (strain FGSC A4 / ATCC 38163 / CBS 112.46 / NRRL 194 / M139) TaxID=227321 RepID=Q5B2F3_EMENI|nr:hypothetical protein [Aspergillus nidulans FGSC A4]EAA62437.1 hypothetical protein AN5277.2 [Aspergillus nidulans FGSC A4]CBF82190.1 TPA: hypothetical protein ANIA_05277 [Aspergillus nidulans FGSC A4]|eukprot:XP_662881.1 hypothetical protein AN5277.2 [Aspergillus nidulans FGSC A4]
MSSTTSSSSSTAEIPPAALVAEWHRAAKYPKPSAAQAALLAMPAVREPQIRQKHIRDGKTFSYVRNSNSEALLGQMVGSHSPKPCTHCHIKESGPFEGCIVVAGRFQGACANCHFGSEGKRCDFHIKNLATTTPKHARKRAAALAALVAGEEEEEDEEAEEEEEDEEEEENARCCKGKAPATSARKGVHFASHDTREHADRVPRRAQRLHTMLAVAARQASAAAAAQEALAQTLLLVAAEYADDDGFQGFGGEEEEEGEGGGDEDESELSSLDEEILTLGRS